GEVAGAGLERYGKLCAENNMQVCNFPTPAQYFHAPRRQMHRNFRKPLVVMSPKSLLRHKLAVSTLGELSEGRFEPVLDDVARVGAAEGEITVDPANVRRIVLCSGKIYYALLAGRHESTVTTAALWRVEQLYPFPRQELEAVRAGYPKAEQVYWVQEEPANMGAWRFIEPLLRPLLGGRTLTYVGRDAAASPASGSYK